MMTTYNVTIVREIRETLDLEVEADSEDDAKWKAEEEEADTSDDCWSHECIIDQKITRVRKARTA
jgi:hypothetical protein